MPRIPANLRFIQRHPRQAALLCVLVTTLGLLGTARLSLKTDLGDLLPDNAPSVVALQELRSRVGSANLVELLLHVPDGDIERVKPVLPRIAEHMEALPQVHTAEFHRSRKFFDDNQLLLFSSVEDLRELRDGVRTEIEKKVAARYRESVGTGGGDAGDDDDDDDEWTGAGWNDEGGTGTEAGTGTGTGNGTGTGTGTDGGTETDAWRRYRDARERIDRELARFEEWYVAKNGKYIALRLFLKISATDLEQATELERTLHDAVPKALAAVAPEMEGPPLTGYLLYGTPFNTLDTVRNIKSDVAQSSVSTLLLLLTILLVAFRQVRPGPRWTGRLGPWLSGWIRACLTRLFVLSLVFVPLLCGLVWTLGFGGLSVGHLNLVTAFIVAILAGLGIDFGVHFLNRYLEERTLGAAPLDALTACQRHTGRASWTAALTTCASFLCLTLADFRGFSDLGLLAGVGVVLCLMALYTVFPTMLLWMERTRPIPVPAAARPRTPGTRAGYPLHRAVAAVCLVGAAAGALMLPEVGFEYNFHKVRLATPELEHKKKERAGADAGRGLGSTYVLYDNEAEAAEGHRLFQRMLKDPAYTALRLYEGVHNFVPLDQEDRLALIGDIRTRLSRKLELFDGDARKDAEDLLRLTDVRRLSLADLPRWLRSELSERPSVDGTPGRVGLFARVRARRPRDGSYFVLRFAEELGHIELSTGRKYLAGPDLVKADVLRLIVQDGRRVLLLALLVVLALISADLRRPRDIAAAVAPLAFGGLWTVGFLAAWDIKLDYFNVLAIPAVLGIGVDSGIHLVHRARESSNAGVLDILSTTGKAVLLAFLTTMAGFSGLLWTHHLGLFSLGKLALIALAACLLASFTVAPAILQALAPAEERGPEQAGDPPSG